MRPQLEYQAVNIVLRGQFNPTIFQPRWFSSEGLIKRQEAEAAEIQVIHPEAAIFQAEWLQLRVLQDRFQAATFQEPYYETLRDLVAGTVSILSYTPLRLLGINMDFHYRLDSEAAWHAVGHRLAPKQDWEDLLANPGMVTLVMQGERPDTLAGYIRVKVEPSPRLQYGVYVNINDHYDLSSDSDVADGSKEVVNILSEQWEDSMRRSSEIAEQISNLGELE